MNVPGSVYVECPFCGEETRHLVIKGKIREKNGSLSFEGTVKCSVCGGVHSAEIREDPPMKIRAVISDGKESEKTSLELSPEYMLCVGDELIAGDIPVRVTSIESGGKRKDHAHVRDIDSVWLKRYDRVNVKFSINRGDKTVSKKISAVPDEDFLIGDSFQIDRDMVVIHKIKTRYGFVQEGSVKARDIVRVYAKRIR